MFTNLKFPDYYSSMVVNPTFLVDTDILSDICKGGKSKVIEEKLLGRDAILLYSLTSIMELGFGPSHLTSAEEESFYRELYGRQSALQGDIFVSDFHMKFKMGQFDHLKGKWVGVSPDSHNWFAAKKSLISYMNTQGANPKNAKKLQIDVLLSCASWNAGAFIWTNNIKDHLLATYFMRHLECTRNRKKNSKEVLNCLAKHMTPVFDTALLSRLLEGDIFNIYAEMKKKTKNTDILKVLEIAEEQIR